MKRYIKKIVSVVLAAAVLNLAPKNCFFRSQESCSDRFNNVSAVDIDEADSVLNDALSQLAGTVEQPSFGTEYGDWSVLCLARSGYYGIEDAYFSDYYERIVDAVKTTAASVNKNGALHNVKSTENSRLILALSAIGKDPENVGGWNLITPYNDFDWIKKQGVNGAAFALIALDSMNYKTADKSVRQQCIEYILEKQFENGGWALSGSVADPNITGMVLQALSRYTENKDVAAAVERGVDCLSKVQLNDGSYKAYGTVTLESAAQVVIACTSLGIDPNTDERFVKNGNSAVDAVLKFYNSESSVFSHVIGDGGNAIATDQAILSLIAYKLFTDGKNGLYNIGGTDSAVQLPSDSDNKNPPNGSENKTDGAQDNSNDNKAPEENGSFDGKNTLLAAVGAPAEISSRSGSSFRASVNMSGWDNNGGYKLLDCIISVPDVLEVTDVTVGSKLGGGQLEYGFEENTGKLRIVYFDPNSNSDIMFDSGSGYAELFSVGFKVKKDISADKLSIGISGMSLKTDSDPYDEDSMTVVDTENSAADIRVVSGISFSAVRLYQGDDVDIIPSSKMAVAVAVTELAPESEVKFNDGKHTADFLYNKSASDKIGIPVYIALVDSEIDMNSFARSENYTVNSAVSSDTLVFGDANGDGVINAQDALASVDVWLRKTELTDDKQMLGLNVNGDGRINTFDALGISEAFVNGSDFGVIEKAAALSGDGNE